MLVFDDLHWADRPTLQLLRHLVRSPAPRRVLFLGTYRESEISDRHPLHELIGDLRREGTLRRLELTGLGEAEVGELVAELASRAGHASPSCARCAGETEGNPFFIEEVVRHIRDTAGALTEEVTLEEAGVPGRRARGHRAAAAAAHRAHARRAAGRVGDRARVRLRRARRRSCRRRATSWSRRSRRASRRACCARPGTSGATRSRTRWCGRRSTTRSRQLRRARLHGRVGEALVALRGGDLDPHLAMLAHHFAQAAPVERPDRAIDFALAAARRADRMLAWEEAAQHYRAALRARELAGAVDDHVRAELLLALGASEDRAGLEEEARETFQAAIRTARQLGDAVLLDARGARAWPGRGRRCRARIPGAWRCWTRRWRRCPRRTRRCARGCSRGCRWSSTTRASRSCGCRCRDEAVRDRPPDRRPADAGDLPGRAPLRAVAARERRGAARGRRRAAARGRGDRRPRARAAGRGLDDHRPDGARRHRGRRHPDRRRRRSSPRRCTARSGCGGRRCSAAPARSWRAQFDEAERLAQETLAIGQRGQAENALHYYAQAMFNIRREQGRLAEVEGAVRGFIELYPAIPAWRGALALLLIELGARTRRARSSSGRRAAASRPSRATRTG